MKLTFKKEFSGDESTLPQRTVPGAVQFREAESMKKLAIVANILAVIIMVVTMVPVFPVFVHYARTHGFESFSGTPYLLLFFIFLVIIPLHELLHAVCFKGDVEFYTALKKGLCFVVGTETMTKGRFIFMSLLPNLVFGFLPYLLYLIFFPGQLWLGLLAAICIGSGAGDYINIWHALTQMPKGSLTYMSGMHSYWYLPQDGAGNA